MLKSHQNDIKTFKITEDKDMLIKKLKSLRLI